MPDTFSAENAAAGYICTEKNHQAGENNNFQVVDFKGGQPIVPHTISGKNVLDQIVLHNLKTVTAFAREQPEEFYAMATQNGEAEAKKFYKTAEREKIQIEKRIKELDNIIRCLYEDRVCGRITPERYDVMAGGYEQEQAELRQELTTITEHIGEIDMREKCIQEFVVKAKGVY